jgi:hypothetical protein
MSSKSIGKVTDFTSCAPLEISTLNLGDQRECYVCIVQRAGSVHFQHTMRPSQARKLAELLRLAADECDGALFPPIAGPG